MISSQRLSLRDVYLYLVCLVTLVISLFAAVGLIRGTVELLYPDPAPYGWAEPIPVGRDGEPELSEEERERQRQLAADSQRRTSVLGLVSSVTTLLVAGPVYVYHWRKVQDERGERDDRAPVATGA